MAELTALHFTDVHEDLGSLQVINDFVENNKDSIDLVYHTGDFVGWRSGGKGGNPKTLDSVVRSEINKMIDNDPKYEKVFKPLKEKYSKLTNQEVSYFRLMGLVDNDPNDESKYESARKNFISEYEKDLEKLILSNIEESYQRIKPEFQKLADKTTVVGVLGNHDFMEGANYLDGIVNFVDFNGGIKVQGKTGVEFTIKGDINSYEKPYLYPFVKEIIDKKYHFIPYELGRSVSEFGNNPQMAQAIGSLHQSNLQRLGKPADIFLVHKQNDVKTKHGTAGGGDTVRIHSERSGSVYGGHFHYAQVAWRNGVLEMRPGTNHFFVCEYGANKKVSAIDIYQIRDAA